MIIDECLSVEKEGVVSLEEVVRFCETHYVVAVAIDAPLTFGLQDETGMRKADERLRQMLSKTVRHWVASFNSLMAVPIRGSILAEFLSPIVGTILETHPRSCLYLVTRGQEINSSVLAYKGVSNRDSIKKLWNFWTKEFGIHMVKPYRKTPTDGLLDSLVCATIAYLYHIAPENLLRLNHQCSEVKGRGPFVILERDFSKN